MAEPAPEAESKIKDNCGAQTLTFASPSNRFTLLRAITFSCAGFLLALCFAVPICSAQDLAPRAYIITPVNSNAVTYSYALYDGSILFSGAVPIADATARVNVNSVAYTRSLNFFGRTANF